MLTFRNSLQIWKNSFKVNNLQTLQDSLIKLQLPKVPKDIIISNEKVNIDGENSINEVNFQIFNDPNAETKHIVFIHGYGASLGCFARNFEMINRFKGLNHNYTIHFLDNLSFGLSSNPKIPGISNIIPKCPPIKLNDNTPTDVKQLHNKYYKLIPSYDINPQQFHQYQQTFEPILAKIEDYYLDAIENWRKSRAINIDYLVGHSYGGYWSGSYALKYNVGKLLLLSPVGVERHVHALGSTQTLDTTQPKQTITPSLDPSKYNFLTRYPILNAKVISKWYNLQPYLPRILKFLGPWGVKMYWNMWYLKLCKINKLITKRNQQGLPTDNKIYGTNQEISLIIEYLYNSITNGTMSDIYIKYLLTPSTVSKIPLLDKFKSINLSPNFGKCDIHLIYGQYDFMNAEAGEKLVQQLNQSGNTATIHSISEGGHNLYIDNPFDTNKLIYDIVKADD